MRVCAGRQTVVQIATTKNKQRGRCVLLQGQFVFKQGSLAIVANADFEIRPLLFQFVADSPLRVPPKMQGHEVAFNKIFDYGSS